MNNSILKSDEYSEKIRDAIKETVWTYSLPLYVEDFVFQHPDEVELSNSWTSFWETLILNMRTTTISYAIHRARCKNMEEQEITKEIVEVEEMVQQTGNQADVSKLELLKGKLQNIRMSLEPRH